MSNSKKNKKRYFTLEDLSNIDTAYNNLMKEEKCHEMLVTTTDDKIICITPGKIIETVKNCADDKPITLYQLLGSSLFDFLFKNKKSKLYKNEKIEKIVLTNKYFRIDFNN